MDFVWQELQRAWPLIWHGNPTVVSVIGFTLEVAAVATALATLIGIPAGLALGLGRFRGRGVLRTLANVSLGLPPVLVGVVLFLILARPAPLGSLELIFTRRSVFLAQVILALPFTTALTAAAVEALAPGLLHQARQLGARRPQLAALALREARIGIVTAIIAALGTALSEVAAVAIVGGNVYGYDQTLSSATLYYADAGNYPNAIATAIVLTALILVLMGAAGLLQQQTSGIRWRFRATDA